MNASWHTILIAPLLCVTGGALGVRFALYSRLYKGVPPMFHSRIEYGAIMASGKNNLSEIRWSLIHRKYIFAFDSDDTMLCHIIYRRFSDYPCTF